MRKAPLCELEPLQGETSGRGVIDARGVRGVRGVTPREACAAPRGVADISPASIIMGDGCADISPASITRGGGCGIDCATANKRLSLTLRACTACAAVVRVDSQQKTSGKVFRGRTYEYFRLRIDMLPLLSRTDLL